MIRITILLFLFVTNVYASRDDVLIVVNDNSIDSPLLGEYYAQKRSIAPTNIAHIKSPSGYYLSWGQFVVLRDQLIKHIQENLIGGATPASCGATASPYYCNASMVQIREQSPIKYIVLTRGIPTRVKVEGESQYTSVDSLLRFWLANYYSMPNARVSALPRAKSFEDGRGMRVIDPSIDKEMIIGRIDGLDLSSAKALIDRAIAAEENGVFGKLYGSQYGSTGGMARWFNYQDNKDIYGVANSTAWRYQHGLFGDLLSPNGDATRFVSNEDCLIHIDSSASSTEGKSPQDCVVRLTDGSDAPPARSSSRQPLVDNGLVYLGSLDGQPTTGNFSDFLNWRKDSQCDVTLCENAVDPAACSVASSDVFKELNTACVGVADGFIGYNFQSYPVSYLAVWPTAWYNSKSNSGESWAHSGGGDSGQLGLPEILNGDSSDGDAKSLWFRNADAIANYDCYTDAAFNATALCEDEYNVFINNRINFSAPVSYNAGTPQTYQLSLKYKAENVDRLSQIKIRFFVHEPGSNRFQVNYGSVSVTLPGETSAHKVQPGDTNVWTEVQAKITIDPAIHAQARIDCLNTSKCTSKVGESFLNTAWDGSYDGMKIRLETSAVLQGSIGFDDIVLTETTGNTPVVIANPSFADGHKQVSAGDHAANFLSRLNGVGFWGSVSHYQTGGHSFDTHPMDTLIYFMRGLPMGDAVWFAESRASGILYGDPLYSPVAIKLHNHNVYADDYINKGLVELQADTVNGTGQNVATTYQVDYCAGADFFDCDQANSWLATSLSGVGGLRDQNLGQWNVVDMPDGEYVLRLAVTSTNAVTQNVQTLYDYYPVKLFIAADDSDGDGLSNGDELVIYGTDMYNADSDGDSLSDFVEIFTSNTNPLLADSDGDQLSDGDEVNNYGTDPNNIDTDGDSFTDGAEVSVGMDPLTANATANPWIGTVTGRVVTPEGKGVAGATFWDVSRYPETVTTDANGYYVLKGYVGGEYVWFNVAGTNSGYTLLADGWDGAPFAHNGGSVVARNYIATPNDDIISGKVTLLNGDPLAAITFWDVLAYPKTVTTLADGSFVSQGYAAGDYSWFNTYNSNNSGYTLSPKGWDGSPLPHTGEAMFGFDYIATPNDSTLSGRITTPDGKPLAGITFWDVFRYPETVTTNADGRFMIQNFTAGDSFWFNLAGTGSDYNFTASGWNNATPMTHDGSAMQMFNFVATPTTGISPWIGTVTGRVVTPEGKGVAGATFWDVSRYPETVTTDANGYYVLKGYVGGEYVWFNVAGTNSGYTLLADGWDGAPFAHNGGSVVARNYIATPNDDIISGKVTLLNGDPLAAITFWDVLAYPKTVTTLADGSFVSQGYAAGDYSWFNTYNSNNSGYTLSPKGWDGSPLPHTGEAMFGFDYIATPNDSTLSGRITTPDGKPLAGITFWDVFRYPETVTTNADGRFMIQNFTAGDSFWFNLAGTGSDYNFTASGWNNATPMTHDGSAMQMFDFVATPK